MRVISLWRWDAKRDVEVSFKKGEQIEVIRADMVSGWWFGKVLSTNLKGYFPMNYVRYSTPQMDDEPDDLKMKDADDVHVSRLKRRMSDARKQRIAQLEQATLRMSDSEPIKSPSWSPLSCSVCNEMADKRCRNCGCLYCGECDILMHQTPSTSNHIRASITASSSKKPSNNGTSETMTTPAKVLFDDSYEVTPRPHYSIHSSEVVRDPMLSDRPIKSKRYISVSTQTPNHNEKETGENHDRQNAYYYDHGTMYYDYNHQPKQEAYYQPSSNDPCYNYYYSSTNESSYENYDYPFVHSMASPSIPTAQQQQQVGKQLSTGMSPTQLLL